MIEEEMLEAFRESLSRAERKILENMGYGIDTPISTVRPGITRW